MFRLRSCRQMSDYSQLIGENRDMECAHMFIKIIILSAWTAINSISTLWGSSSSLSFPISLISECYRICESWLCLPQAQDAKRSYCSTKCLHSLRTKSSGIQKIFVSRLLTSMVYLNEFNKGEELYAKTARQDGMCMRRWYRGSGGTLVDSGHVICPVVDCIECLSTKKPVHYPLVP